MPSPGKRHSSRRARSRPPAGRPGQPSRGTRGAQPLLTPKDVAPVRHVVERRGAIWLLYLSRMPRWALAVLAAALFLAGVLAPGVPGAVATALLAVLLAWLAYVTWPTVSSAGRGMRVLVVAVLVMITISKLA